MDNKTKIVAALLYKFLMKEHILTAYYNNIKHSKDITNPKDKLYRCVEIYENTSRPPFNYIGVFGDVRCSFLWSNTIEGVDFWTKMTQKWVDFYRYNEDILYN
jgi:hypothetical protein